MCYQKGSGSKGFMGCGRREALKSSCPRATAGQLAGNFSHTGATFLRWEADGHGQADPEGGAGREQQGAAQDAQGAALCDGGQPAARLRGGAVVPGVGAAHFKTSTTLTRCQPAFRSSSAHSLAAAADA